MKKRSSVTLLFILSAVLAHAQTGTPTNSSMPTDSFNTLFYGLMACVMVVLLLVVVVVFYIAQMLNRLTKEMALEKAHQRGEVLQKVPGFWTKLSHWLTASTPIEKEETIILDHSYDGIRELDNHLPPWWTALLYGSIVWGAVYLFVYHVSDSFPLPADEYRNELAYAGEQLQKMQVDNKETIDENTVTLTTDEGDLQDGKKTFENICASCHRPDGGGDIGPNLTDAYWLHGGSIKDIFKVISKGVPNTNMISWASSLSPKKMQDVASYVLTTLQGTSPPDAKSPQGELYKDQQGATPESGEEKGMEEKQPTDKTQDM